MKILPVLQVMMNYSGTAASNCLISGRCVRMTKHFFVNFDVSKGLYLNQN